MENPTDSSAAQQPKAAKSAAKPARANFRNLKVPKGTRDFRPDQMIIREKVLETITNCFKRHGACTIDTPVFELRETLTNKYGEDSKLIYDLQDQGGEICSLRYDLTVPFARYVAMNRIKQIKRYHIAKVYRRDNPAMARGRFREFYQCDYDIAGEYDSMIPDSDCLKLMSEILSEVDVGPFSIKLNHRKLLDGIFSICGVTEDNFRPICSAVDKLDKSPWEEVEKEMVEVKKLPIEVAKRIKHFVEIKGEPFEVLAKLTADPEVTGNASCAAALADLKVLFEYLEVLEGLKFISFDLSLARGLDYYTGVIYEAVLTSTDRVGSIAAGGRYDGLIGSLGGTDIPAVGFSVGIERLFNIIEEEVAKKNTKLRSSSTQVLVCSIDKGLLKERLKLSNLLWQNGIRAEYLYRENPKLQPQLTYANSEAIPFAIIFGQRELDSNKVMLKNLANSTQEELDRDQLVEVLRKRLAGELPPASASAPAAAEPVAAAAAATESQN